MLPSWEDESGFEDLDVDQLVSQHRSRVSPPTVPASRADPVHQRSSQQHAVRPAAAAASANVRRSAMPASTPPVTLQPATVPPQSHLIPSTHADDATCHPAAALGLDGIKERLLDLADQLLDAQLDSEQQAVLQEERRSLMAVKEKLQAAQAGSQYGRPPPDPYPSAPPSLGNIKASTRMLPASSGSGYQAAQSNSWQPSAVRQAVQTIPQRSSSIPSRGVCDTAAPISSSMGQQQWQSQGQSSAVYGGSTSFAYDAPDPAPRDDMGMPVPDPTLRASSSSEPEGFVTCHQHDGLEDKRWDKTFDWSTEMQHALEGNFGTKTFRANQRQAINASLAGKDVFVLMPTGGGIDLTVTHNQNLHTSTPPGFVQPLL